MTWSVLAIVLLISYSAEASENPEVKRLVWPTNASHLITSSFGEYRENHFHSGIDIKTWGQTGYKVFAVADGWVSRIKVSPYGYGRALYITLNDGRTVVYGHLQDYADPISDYVWNAQKNRGQYSVELFPAKGEFSVTAGQLVAYTGESGVGPPHLHFEIRNDQEEPLNPLTQGLQIEDDVRPVIAEIAISPMNCYSRVNKSPLPYFVRVHAVNGTAVLSDPISVQGQIGFSVRANDWAVPDGNIFNIYRAVLQIGDSTWFQTTYDRFSYTETRQILLDREWRFNVQGKGKFTKLYRHPRSSLDFGHSKMSGIVDSRKFDSLVPFRITVEDHSGNVSQVRGELLMVKPPVAPMYMDDVNEPIMSDSLISDLAITPVFFDNYLSVALPAEFVPGTGPKGWVCAASRTALSWELNDNGKWYGSAPLDFDYSGQMELAFWNTVAPGRKKYGYTTWEQWGIRPNRQQTISFPEAGFTLSFNRNTLWQPICVRIDSNDFPVGNLPYLTKGWKIEPKDIPLAGNAQIVWDIPPDQTTVKQIGIYRWTRSNYWRILTPFAYSEDRSIEAPTDELGIFALIRDDQAPQVVAIYPKEGAAVTTAKPRLVVQIGDILSGFDEDGIRMFLDDEPVISEYDPDARYVIYQPREPLASGEHRLVTQVRDRAGNLTIQQTNFRITGGSR
jgi:hypothetical protein